MGTSTDSPSARSRLPSPNVRKSCPPPGFYAGLTGWQFRLECSRKVRTPSILRMTEPSRGSPRPIFSRQVNPGHTKGAS